MTNTSKKTGKKANGGKAVKATKKMTQRGITPHDGIIGKKVRLRRIEQKISQSELGDMLGVSFQQVQKYEKGVNRVSSGRLQQIATALEVDINFFYEGNKTTNEVESLLFLDSNFSMRLLKAYSAVPSQKIQRSFVALMEAVANPEVGE